MNKEDFSVFDRLIKAGLVGDDVQKLAKDLLDEFPNLEAVKELKENIPPSEMKKDMRDMFHAFLASDASDDKEQRLRKLTAYQYMEDFLEAIVTPKPLNPEV